MTDVKHCAPFPARHVPHSAKTFSLEGDVSYGKHFIHNEDFRFQMRGYRKSESHIHAGRVPLNWGVNELFYLGEIHDLIKLLFDLGALNTQDRSIEEDIFPACKLRVKTGAYFQQACH